MTQKSTLDLYTNFFGLSRRPFALVPDPKFLFWSDHHRQAYSMLEYGILTRAPITLVTGEVGAGKSTLLFHMLEHAGEELRIGLVANAHGNRGELMHWVLQSLGLAPKPEESYVQLFGRLQEYLIAEYAKGRRVVLIFDEAQNLSRESLEELRMLTNVNSGADELLQLVLVGQPELVWTVRQPSLKQFAQRVASSVHLPAMDASAVKAYLDHRLRIAGAQSEIFTAEAAKLIHETTGGIPRLINQLADMSLVYAYTADVRQVDAPLVQKVLDEGTFLGIRVPDLEETAIKRFPAIGGEIVRSVEKRHDRNLSALSGTPAPSGILHPVSVVFDRSRDDGRRGGRAAAAIEAADRPAIGASSASLRDGSTQHPVPADEDREPAPILAAKPAPRQDDEDGIGPIASSTVDSLADLEPTKPISAAREVPKDEAVAAPADRDSEEGVDEDRDPESTTRRRNRLGGPGLLMAAIALALGIMAFGADELLLAINDTQRVSGTEMQASVELAEASTEGLNGASEASQVAIAETSGMATDVPAVDPAEARLPTPSLPTVAGAEISAAGLYNLALDLALVDQPTAAIAFARAGSRGHSRAAYYLAQLYETGDGLPMNLSLASAWYSASDLPNAQRQNSRIEDLPRSDTITAPRLLSASHTDDGMLELVWAGSADARDATYFVEVFDSAGRLVPDGTRRTQLSALRLPAPAGVALWRVTAEGAGRAAMSDPQRIPTATARVTKQSVER